MLAYRQNNIHFRACSSLALARFKEIQAHSFLQVVRHEIEFDSSSRETLLLEYDRISQWLFRLERAFLLELDGIASADLAAFSVSNLREELLHAEEISQIHTSIFSKAIRDFMTRVRFYSFTALEQQITSAMAKTSLQDSFAACVAIASDYLQHLMLALYEYDNNIVKGKTPFITVSKFGKFIEGSTKVVPALQRALYFTSLMHPEVDFEIRNYIDEHDETMSDICEAFKNEGLNFHLEILENQAV